MSLAKKRQEALGAGLGSGDRLKLGLMISALLIVLIVFAGATLFDWEGAEDEETPERPADGEATNRGASEILEGPDGEIEARVSLPEEGWTGLGKEVPPDPEKLIDIRDDTDDSQMVIERDPFEYLVKYVAKEPTARRKWRGFDKLARDVLMGAPSKHRGRPVEFKGRLLGFSELSVESGGIENVTPLHRGFIEILVPVKGGEAPGGIVSFTSIGPPVFEDRQEDPARVGSVVRIHGYFLKIWRARPPDADSLVSSPHLVTRRFIETYRVVEQKKLDPMWFKSADGPNIDEPPFWLAMNYLRHLTPETYRKRREEGAFQVVPIPEPNEDWPEGPVPDDVITDFGSRGGILDQRHEQYRGKLVRLSGTFVRIDPVVPPENEGGIDRYYDCFLAQESNFIIPVVVPFKPSRYGAVDTNVNIEIEGYFYKRRIWEPESGDRRLRGPLIIVTDIIPQETSEGAYRYLTWILGGVAVAFVLTLVVMLVMDRRSSKKPARRRRRTMPSEDAAKDGEEAGSEGGGETDEKLDETDGDRAG